MKSGITGEPVGDPPPAWAKPLVRVFGSGLGSGYVPFAQGTFGSLILVLLWFYFMPENVMLQLAAIILIHLISVPLSKWGEAMWGEDAGRITIDEFAGQSIALLALPKAGSVYFIAFVFFRLHDSMKYDWMKRKIEPIPNGWGVTLDDSVAGVFALIETWLFIWILGY